MIELLEIEEVTLEPHHDRLDEKSVDFDVEYCK
jgi:hypothetical protein